MPERTNRRGDHLPPAQPSVRSSKPVPDMRGEAVNSSRPLLRRLRLPLIAAPMLHVSGPELVIAACRAGVIGAFPTANARSIEVLDDWLSQLDASGASAPYCANLIIRQPHLQQHLERLIDHRVE